MLLPSPTESTSLCGRYELRRGTEGFYRFCFQLLSPSLLFQLPSCSSLRLLWFLNISPFHFLKRRLPFRLQPFSQKSRALIQYETKFVNGIWNIKYLKFHEKFYDQKFNRLFNYHLSLNLFRSFFFQANVSALRKVLSTLVQWL